MLCTAGQQQQPSGRRSPVRSAANKRVAAIDFVHRLPRPQRVLLDAAYLVGICSVLKSVQAPGRKLLQLGTQHRSWSQSIVAGVDHQEVQQRQRNVDASGTCKHGEYEKTPGQLGPELHLLESWITQMNCVQFKRRRRRNNRLPLEQR